MRINRRELLHMATVSTIGAGLVSHSHPQKTHIVTLSFDDGFKKSFYRTAEIYEQFGLRACFNVIAITHSPEFQPKVDGRPDPGLHESRFGNFDDWNALKKRGHEVMAHTYDHTDLTKIPLPEARALIVKCANYFEAHLDGFKASRSVYNFAYNASTPELEQFALTKFLAVRSQGETAVNPIPKKRHPTRIGCWSYGPENSDSFLDNALKAFLGSAGGWFVFNTHGLDGEGWGPLSATYLVSLLGRLSKMEHVAILPAGAVLL